MLLFIICETPKLISVILGQFLAIFTLFHLKILQGDVKTKDDNVISQISQPRSHEIDSSFQIQGRNLSP